MAKKERAIQNLYNIVDEFSKEMKAKLLQKYKEGYRGYDAPKNIVTMQCRLRKNFRDEDYIDVANLAMFLHNLQKQGFSLNP